VKNVTISLPDDVYRKARIQAAERETSISGLVRDLLTKATQAEELEAAALQRKRRMNEILDEIHKDQQARGKYFSASQRLSREEVHDRKAFR
jgi:plasmid stability protein